ncbi:MAG: hypothetical protein RLY86_2065, partial [Pseudomonadota bacterium]
RAFALARPANLRKPTIPAPAQKKTATAGGRVRWPLMRPAGAGWKDRGRPPVRSGGGGAGAAGGPHPGKRSRDAGRGRCPILAPRKPGPHVRNGAGSWQDCDHPRRHPKPLPTPTPGGAMQRCNTLARAGFSGPGKPVPWGAEHARPVEKKSLGDGGALPYIADQSQRTCLWPPLPSPARQQQGRRRQPGGVMQRRNAYPPTVP